MLLKKAPLFQFLLFSFPVRMKPTEVRNVLELQSNKITRESLNMPIASLSWITCTTNRCRCRCRFFWHFSSNIIISHCFFFLFEIVWIFVDCIYDIWAIWFFAMLHFSINESFSSLMTHKFFFADFISAYLLAFLIVLHWCLVALILLRLICL